MYDDRDGIGTVVGHSVRPYFEGEDVIIPASFLVDVDFGGDRHSMAEDWIRVLPLPRNRSLVKRSF
jgi:hypothetical protein